MIDRHAGRQTPVFDISNDPETFIQLINKKGILSRILSTRKCPCQTTSGSPNMYCNLCFGDGQIYEYQRQLFQQDEDSDKSHDGTTIRPFRIPLLKPVKVERLLAECQGGIKEYPIISFTDEEIKIEPGIDPVLHYEKLRVSYYFDRFTFVENELPVIEGRVITTINTRYNDEHKSSNFFNVHGDIVQVEKVEDIKTGHIYSNFTFRKNRIFISDNEPEPTPQNTSVTYYYCPPAKILTADVETEEKKEDRWQNVLIEGNCRMALEPWFELSQGDLITLLTPTLYKNEILTHTQNDKLHEFDIDHISNIIFDQDGNEYINGSDFILTNFRDILWLGNEPDIGKQLSIRYGYHPTFSVWINNPQPNTLENKLYPIIVYSKYWNKTKDNDITLL